jgi:tape measure domain-containing protein
MDLKRTLTVEIDPTGAVSGGKRAQAAFVGIGKAAQDTSGKLRDAQGRFVGVGGAARSAADGMGHAQGATSRLSAAFSSMRAASGAVIGAFMSLKTAIAGMALGVFARQLVDTQLSMDRISQSLKFATGSAEEGARALEWIRRVSKVLGLDFNSAATEFAKFAAAAKGTKIDFEEQQRIFLAVSKAAVVMGLSQDQVAGTFMALQQMISKGTVQAEELRGQLGERLPGAFQMAARAMGVTTQQLGKMLEQGKVTAEDLLPKLAREMERAFGKDVVAATESLNSGMNRLKTAWTEFKEAVLKSGVVDYIASMVKSLTEAVNKMATFVRAYASHNANTGNSWIDAFNKGNPLAWAARGLATWMYDPDMNPDAPGGRNLLASPRAAAPMTRAQEIASLSPDSGKGYVTLPEFKVFKPFADGALSQTKKLRDEMTNWRNAGMDAVNAMESGFTGFFRNIVTGTMTVSAAFKEMAKNILADIATILLRAAIAQPIAAAIGGAMGINIQGPSISPSGTGGQITAPTSHIGGIVGAGGTRFTSFPAALFSGAPRFHSGLRPDEFPAILQRGEEVVPKNEVGKRHGDLVIPVSVTVNMNGSDGSREDGQRMGAEVSRQIEGMVRSIILRERMAKGVLA